MATGTHGPYPQPYTMQEEQRAEPRRERPVESDPGYDLKVALGALIAIVAIATIVLWRLFL